jgi:maleate isomerase
MAMLRSDVIRLGVLTPHVAPGPEVELPAMASGRLVVRIARVAPSDGGPATVGELVALADPLRLERAAETLTAEGVDMIGYASTTSAYAIGFGAEEALVSSLEQLTGLPAASSCAAAVHALHALAAERVALVGAPWFSRELNELGASYFRDQGFEVTGSASAELSLDPGEIEPEAVVEWIEHNVDDDAEAVFVGGNGFRAAAAVEPLEAALDRPVLTSNQVLLWQLLRHAHEPVTIDRFGRLFA